MIERENQVRYGYACVCMSLQRLNEAKCRGIQKKTFLAEGPNYAANLAIENAKDLLKIIKWNEANGFTFFRMSSELIPWASEFDLEDLIRYDTLYKSFEMVGDYAKAHNHRLTFHPGPFNVLVSENDNVVERTIKDLTNHGEIMDMMGLSRTPFNKINIHCNGVYGNKQAAMDRFCRNFERLPESVQTRLTVENDDKASMYSVKDLMYIHERIGIPIVFDYFHHTFNTGGLTEKEALELAMSTWSDDIVPVVHYSESRRIEDPKAKSTAHSDYIYDEIYTYGYNLDVMVEAKMKDYAVINYIEKYYKLDLELS